FVRGNENNPDTSAPLEPAVPQLFGSVDLKIQPVNLPVDDYFPDGRRFVPDDLRAQANAAVAKEEAALKEAREKKAAEPVIAAAVKRVEAAKAAIPPLEAHQGRPGSHGYASAREHGAARGRGAQTGTRRQRSGR